ncbi:MAG: hypothetical protein WBF83_09445 [Moheibacter sp.]
MTPKNFLKALLIITGINIGLLLVAALFDILLAAIFTVEIAPLCFAVIGIFSGLFSYTASIGNVPDDKQKQTSLQIMILSVIFSIILFCIIAPFSTSEYKLPVQCFAVTQLITSVCLWKMKFYKEL